MNNHFFFKSGLAVIKEVQIKFGQQISLLAGVLSNISGRK
jgi:hypothetical protein